jgi:hypothetical protein
MQFVTLRGEVVIAVVDLPVAEAPAFTDVNISQFDRIFKEAYLGPIRELFNAPNPLLARLGRERR